jgi:hypothetical protein
VILALSRLVFSFMIGVFSETNVFLINLVDRICVYYIEIGPSIYAVMPSLIT